VDYHTHEMHEIKCPTNKNDFTVFGWIHLCPIHIFKTAGTQPIKDKLPELLAFL